jgi:hypothetical protein
MLLKNLCHVKLCELLQYPHAILNAPIKYIFIIPYFCTFCPYTFILRRNKFFISILLIIFDSPLKYVIINLELVLYLIPKRKEVGYVAV